MVDGCTERYLNFGLEGGRLITLDRAEAEQHNSQILRVHAIASDRSEDLRRQSTHQQQEQPAPAAASVENPAPAAAAAAVVAAGEAA